MNTKFNSKLKYILILPCSHHLLVKTFFNTPYEISIKLVAGRVSVCDVGVGNDEYSIEDITFQ